MAKGRSFTKLKYRKRKRQSKRRFKRRTRAVTLWPQSKLVRFKAVNQFTRTPAGGAIDNMTIDVGSLNDPFGGAGAELPLGLDQWSAMYSRYVVVGCKVWVRAHNVTSTGALTFGLTRLPPGDTTGRTSASHYLEMPGTVSKILSPDVDHANLVLSYSAKRHNRVKNIRDAKELHGTFSTTPGAPTVTTQMKLWTQDVNATDNGTLEGFITAEYVVLLLDPILPARSAL